MDYFQIALNGEYAGQDVVNVLWYRAAGLTDISAEYLNYMEALAAEVKENIWLAGTDVPASTDALKDVVPVGYTLQSIKVYGWSDDFSLFSSDPYTLDVGETGAVDQPTNGPTACAILRCNLNPVFGPGIGLPKSGYFAIGPLADGAVTNTGAVHEDWVTILESLGRRLAWPIETELPSGVFAPIRVRLTRVAGLVTDIGYKDIGSVSVRSQTSFRRSRQPEA